MNKRTKIKKNIIQKRCDMGCPIHNVIKSKRLITCNACIDCKYRDIAEHICEENRKESGIEVCDIK